MTNVAVSFLVFSHLADFTCNNGCSILVQMPSRSAKGRSASEVMITRQSQEVMSSRDQFIRLRAELTSPIEC